MRAFTAALLTLTLAGPAWGQCVPSDLEGQYELTFDAVASSGMLNVTDEAGELHVGAFNPFALALADASHGWQFVPPAVPPATFAEAFTALSSPIFAAECDGGACSFFATAEPITIPAGCDLEMALVASSDPEGLLPQWEIALSGRWHTNMSGIVTGGSGNAHLIGVPLSFRFTLHRCVWCIQ